MKGKETLGSMGVDQTLELDQQHQVKKMDRGCIPLPGWGWGFVAGKD